MEGKQCGIKCTAIHFDPGDKVVIDTESAHVTVNGKDVIHLKDVFSDFPMIIRGNNRIDIMPPEVGKAAVSFRRCLDE